MALSVTQSRDHLGRAPGGRCRAGAGRSRLRGHRSDVGIGRALDEALGADSPAILYNGGRVFDFDAGRILHERRLAAESARQALALIRVTAISNPTCSWTTACTWSAAIR